jgi:hypothetical protein
MQNLQNLYSITQDTMTASNNSTYLEPGIHENIVLKEIKRGVAKNGSDFLAIYFENEQGDKVSYTEFPLRFRKDFSDMNSEELTKSLKRVEFQMSRWRQICEVFKPNCSLVANSFSEFIDKVISFIGNSYKDKKLRIKVVYDDRNFTTLDSNPTTTFIESMTVSAELTKIRMLPTDKVKREKPDKERVETNEVETLLEPDTKEGGGETKGDDLPF